MIKHSKFLIFGFFISFISSLYTMEIVITSNNLPTADASKKTTDASKEEIKKLIIKYQLRKKSLRYLAQLLSLNRNELLNIIETENQKHQSSLENNFIQTILSLIGYENKGLKKIRLAVEALYLTSTTEEDIKNNKKQFHKLSLKYHPDKDTATDPELKNKHEAFFKEMEPLLSRNEPNNCLDIIDSINKKVQKINAQIENPSIFKFGAHFLSSITLPIFGKGIGTILAHNSFAQIMPRSANENMLRDICVASARKTALEIEMKLVKLPIIHNQGTLCRI